MQNIQDKGDRLETSAPKRQIDFDFDPDPDFDPDFDLGGEGAMYLTGGEDGGD